MTSRWCLLVLFLCFTSAGAAGGEAACDQQGENPDLILGDIVSVDRLGAVGDVAAYSMGTTTCNVGTCPAQWSADTPDHPVFTQNLYRLEDGRFEQLGLSWVRHGFFALENAHCSQNCVAVGGGDRLGAGCSTVNNASINGYQPLMGPRSEVDPATGEHPHPYQSINETGDAIFKRLQVDRSDLDPAQHPGARYFAEVQLVAGDDAGAGHAANSVSWREVQVMDAGGGAFQLVAVAPTVRERPAISAWPAIDPTVVQTPLDGADGQFTLAARVSPAGPDQWAYEYAVHNLTSARAGGSFHVPLPWGANVSDAGFHAVPYHSGEPYDDAAWEITIGPLGITWATTPYETDPEANALRWGTLYNFRFTADVPPATVPVTLGLFRPGSPAALTAGTLAPRTCDADGVCEPGEDCQSCEADCAGGGGTACCGDGTCEPGETACGCPDDCGPPPVEEFSCGDGDDDDCDGLADCNDSDCCLDDGCAGADGDGDQYETCDCDDGNTGVWSVPGEVTGLTLGEDGSPGGTALTWAAPVDPGAIEVTYETLRSMNPINFLTSTGCLTGPDGSVPQVVDVEVPPVGSAFYYVTRAVNGCPAGAGTLGRSSDDLPRQGRDCP